MPDRNVAEPHVDATAFENDLQAALHGLQTAIGAVVEALPQYPRNGPQLSRQLGLERNIAWKLFRLMNERDVLAAARFVPGSASIAAFVESATRAKIAPALTQAVAAAAERYERVLHVHAGDRVSADIMLGAKFGEAGELALRRGAFRSMSFLAGIQAQAQLQTFIVAPAADGSERFDGVSLNGFVDLRRMRPDAVVVIGRPMATDDSGIVLRQSTEETIDPPSPEDTGVPLLRDYCSSPPPRFRQVPGEWGFVENELVEGPVGKTGAITFMAGNLIRAMGTRYRDADNRNMDFVTRLRTPSAALVTDIILHDTLFASAAPKIGVYSDLFGDALRRGPNRERYRLSSAPRIEFIGRGPTVAKTPEIPRYPRMLQHVFDRLGWDSEKFNIHRLHIAFPFSPTSVVVSLELPERP